MQPLLEHWLARFDDWLVWWAALPYWLRFVITFVAIFQVIPVALMILKLMVIDPVFQWVIPP